MDTSPGGSGLENGLSSSPSVFKSPDTPSPSLSVKDTVEAALADPPLPPLRSDKENSPSLAHHSAPAAMRMVSALADAAAVAVPAPVSAAATGVGGAAASQENSCVANAQAEKEGEEGVVSQQQGPISAPAAPLAEESQTPQPHLVYPQPTSSSSSSDAEVAPKLAASTPPQEASPAPEPDAASNFPGNAPPIAAAATTTVATTAATPAAASAPAAASPTEGEAPYPPADLPCMRARLHVGEDGAHVYQGRWGMTAAAHADESQTSPFELRLAAPAPGAPAHAVPASGTYSGFFMLQQGGGKSSLRVDERQVTVSFTAHGGGGEAGVFNAQGTGRNRFGSFVVTGRFLAASGEVELFRSYVKATKASESRKRQQAAKDRSGAPAQRARTQAAPLGGAAAGHPTQGGKSIQGLSQALPRSDSSDVDAHRGSQTGRVPRSSRGDWKDKADMPRRAGGGSDGAGSGGSLSHGASAGKSRGKGKQAPGGAVGGLPAPPALVAATSSSLPSCLADGTQSKAGRIRRVPSHLQDQPEDKPVRLKEPLRKCAQVLKNLMASPHAKWFNQPVDPVALDIPDYLTVVKRPMDLSTVKGNLESGTLETPEQFKAAVLLVFSNAVLYNTNKEHAVHIAARTMRQLFEDKFRSQVEDPLRRAAENDATLATARANATAARVARAGGGPGAGGSGKKARSNANKAASARAGRVKSGPRGNQKLGQGVNGGASAPGGSPRAPAARPKAPAAGMVPLSQVQEIQRQMQMMQETINMLQQQTSQNEQLQNHLQLSAAAPAAPSRKKAQDDHRPLSESEKVALSTAMERLPSTKLPRVLEIIRERMPGFSDEDQEIEIDINALDTPTLRHLQRYVKSCSKKRKPTAPKQQHPSPGIPELEIDLQSLEATALGTDEYKRMRPDAEIGLDLPFTPSDLPDGLDEDNFGS
mmetsp:Transcript_16213/g.47596  ORF Transcript_16213/g.47596 Transcript_16213/m.47596 type:complete len:930 (-) Transcript_16213:531-3320(-)